MRKELAENIVIIGGTSMLAGFHHRLRAELYDLLKTPKYQKEMAIKEFRFHQLPANQNYAAWLGGKIYFIFMPLNMSKRTSVSVFLFNKKLNNSGHKPILLQP